MRLRGLVALVWAAAVFGASLPVDAQAPGPIRIGASLSLTGTYAKLGNYQHEGYKLCAKQVNDKGGLLGRKVEFVVYDDQSTPATGVRLYEKLITEDKVDAVVGPYSSPITEAVANVTEKYKKVMVTPLAATTYFDDAVAITRQMKELNLNPKMYGITVGGDLPEFYDLLKQNAEYIYGATQWEATLPYPGNKEFAEAYT